MLLQNSILLQCNSAETIFLYHTYHFLGPNTIYYLSLIFLYDYFVSQACCPHAFDSLHQGLLYIYFSTALIKALGRYSNNQVVSQGLCPLQKPSVPTMQQIISSIGYYFCHLLKNLKCKLYICRECNFHN